MEVREWGSEEFSIRDGISRKGGDSVLPSATSTLLWPSWYQVSLLREGVFHVLGRAQRRMTSVEGAPHHMVHEGAVGEGERESHR